jgi:hypothetical protein
MIETIQRVCIIFGCVIALLAASFAGGYFYRQSMIKPEIPKIIWNEYVRTVTNYAPTTNDTVRYKELYTTYTNTVESLINAPADTSLHFVIGGGVCNSPYFAQVIAGAEWCGWYLCGTLSSDRIGAVVMRRF